MARHVELRPINDIVNEVRENALREAEVSYKCALERGEEKVKKIELNRQAFALLDAAGFDLELSTYHNGSYYHLGLGHFPNTKRGNRDLGAAIRRVCVALGCGLEDAGKTVADYPKNAVEYRRKPRLFPGVTVEFTRPLKKGAKCKIVRQRGSTYTSLVCEA